MDGTFKIDLKLEKIFTSILLSSRQIYTVRLRNTAFEKQGIACLLLCASEDARTMDGTFKINLKLEKIFTSILLSSRQRYTVRLRNTAFEKQGIACLLLCASEDARTMDGTFK
ncbi:hypothetical protein CDAR_169631 [Caerostris darwini]|uniref:Uncharacterized protein n=1 Tax=Caerostris darwini TaxID=1538125 RepID=A0AAV4PH54_9ARAC|nr:hypothetical protein CDAR_169631 [Caerostris darwini]